VACSSNAESSSAAAPRLVKVCGVTTEEDAAFAASCGANMIGMILWPKAKRSIPLDVARRIAAAARAHGALPVGVFVDEDAATIADVCEQTGVEVAQLHGDGARQSLLDLPLELRTVFVLHADATGAVKTQLPSQLAASRGRILERPVDWLLIDSLQGGSGERFDWDALSVPRKESSRGWLLAGGLTPANVAEAIATANPTGVDVSSGVCGPDGIKKDFEKVQEYIQGAQEAFKVL